MDLGDLNKVWEIKPLKKKHGEDEARKILEKIAKQVQPIMHKHKWRVKLLSEFCPKNPRLLGLNVGGGVHVKLRLRRLNSDWDFYPYDQVLDTMLHELCHNAHGPHNASFYKLWDELRKECEELMAKGISGTGEGFDLPGRRLGGFSRQPPLSSLHKTALAAAENRARMGTLLPHGPKRLGGDSTIMVALSPIQAAAMAAERRLQDDIWCGSAACEDSEEGPGEFDCCAGQSAERSTLCSGFSSTSHSSVVSRKRSRDLDNASSSDHLKSNFVNLSMEGLTPSELFNQDSKSGNRSCATDLDLTTISSVSGLTHKSDATPNAAEPIMWECRKCTLLNPHLAPVCELCTAEKPKDTGTKYKFWSCKFCTLENSVKLEKCCACEQWRYSRGPPVSTPAPYFGT